MEGNGRTLERTAEERVDVIDGVNFIGGDSALGGGAGDTRVQASVSISSIWVSLHLHVVVEEQLQGTERDR